MKNKLYIEIVLPIPLEGTFTYFVPTEMETQVLVGSLVLVKFGKSNKPRRGLVLYLKKNPSPIVSLEKIKPILSIESILPVVLRSQLRFWKWISDYYLCTLGEVFKKAIPSSFHTVNSQLKNCNVLPVFSSALNRSKKKIIDNIMYNFQKKDICLLHKNIFLGEKEIYIQIIERMLRQKKQILYLLPDIALATCVINRLKYYFGNIVGVYHSKINLSKQIEIWNNLLYNDVYSIILGVHSSIFLPFKNLGLIIVDEEHDPNYKQQKASFCYHVRNAAIFLATIHGAKVLLGSATPSIESFYNAQIGKYAYIKLYDYLPQIKPLYTIVDVKGLKRLGNEPIFSPLLIKRIKQKLENGVQVLLFQNRRGFSFRIFCKICYWTPKCHFCDISLIYHKKNNQLVCHYCGKNYSFPKECPKCGNIHLKSIGYGTEKVEEEIKMIFNNVVIDRMDFDTVKQKSSLKKVISNFESGQTQILIGTQMVFRWLNMSKVGLIAILNIDVLMNFPDFRAYERTYQLILQILGKVCGNKIQSEVIIQTFHPDHQLIKMIIRHDYRNMYDMQIKDRVLFKYPPLFRLIHIFLYNSDEKLLCKLSDGYIYFLKKNFGNDRVVGHDRPIVGKTKGLYVRKILLKIEINSSSSFVRKILKEIYMQIFNVSYFRRGIVHYDVDPV
ncbi:MAG: primosomal protein N' [Bacteroidales bacterium OttesenSCG-928-I14]|nr:primosomal protein N' [Bacteroidales bacterium OttesenSCG-928-I14]